MFQKLRARRETIDKFSNRHFEVVCSLNLTKKLRSKFDPFTLFCYFERKLKFTKRRKMIKFQRSKFNNSVFIPSLVVIFFNNSICSDISKFLK